MEARENELAEKGAHLRVLRGFEAVILPTHHLAEQGGARQIGRIPSTMLAETVRHPALVHQPGEQRFRAAYVQKPCFKFSLVLPPTRTHR
eukprot:7661845-Pyramimonas_sp.AAC.1